MKIRARFFALLLSFFGFLNGANAAINNMASAAVIPGEQFVFFCQVWNTSASDWQFFVLIGTRCYPSWWSMTDVGANIALSIPSVIPVGGYTQSNVHYIHPYSCPMILSNVSDGYADGTALLNYERYWFTDYWGPMTEQCWGIPV